MERPELTFPAPVARLVERVYQNAQTILEYGSGGSTILAAELEGKNVYSVESDKAWAERMTDFVNSQNFNSNVIIHHADIGPTGIWGKPADPTRWFDYVAYPFSVWEQDGFVAPDAILIDGRFRTACFLASVFLTPKPVTILFDDYTHRAQYRVVEDIVRPIRTVDRMAVFEVEPRTLPRSQFIIVVREFFKVSMVPSFYQDPARKL